MTKTNVLLCATITTILLSCAPTKQSSSVIQRMPAKFDYSPPSRQQVGSASLTIALIKPKFINNEPQYLTPPFNDMAISMGNDFEELLTAKGFTMRGPFGSRDEMVFGDKTNSDFALEINIDLNSSQYNRKYKYSSGMGVLIPASYKMTGDVILGGDLIITASSPRYGEKIWKKNITLDKLSFSYVGSIKWDDNPTLESELKQDNVVYNAFARELEKYYQQAMKLAWQQIEVIEMKSVSEQAKKADKKNN